MKRTYQELEMEIILLDACDILTLSLSKSAADPYDADDQNDGIVVDNLNGLISGGN